MLTSPNITTLNPKLWIVDYFSDLINTIDISTEKIIYRCKISNKINHSILDKTESKQIYGQFLFKPPFKKILEVN